MVYLVDDDEDDLALVQEGLMLHSYKGPIVLLNNGSMLLDKLAATEAACLPKVIVLDLNMPLIDGFQALHAIRYNPAYKDTPIVILTASSSKLDELKCFELGCNHFLNKPTKMSEYHHLTTIVKQFASA